MFAGLFVGSMFPSVLVHCFHFVLAFVLVGMSVPDLVRIKKLGNLFACIEHAQRRHALWK